MGLSAIDILVLIVVAAAAVMGALRGFVSEVLSLVVWILIVFAVRLFHTPLTHSLANIVGTVAGAAVLAFAVLVGITWIGGRMVANAIGRRTRESILGPLDRALGLAFGAFKGLIFASLGFALLMLVIDTVRGGRTHRPDWVTASRTYPILDATSAGVLDFIDRRRRGEPVWAPRPRQNDDAGNG